MPVSLVIFSEAGLADSVAQVQLACEQRALTDANVAWYS